MNMKTLVLVQPNIDAFFDFGDWSPVEAPRRRDSGGVPTDLFEMVT
ncbi:MAG: hypothetical protein NT171_04335 [Planctomycetota bacterium]|nr:hypothetical protein [Planctomycetota bacterium]